MQLSSPLSLGEVTLPNRILMAPLTRMRADENHVPGPLLAEHYRQRASAGLLIAEATMVAADAHAFGAGPGKAPGIFGPAHVAGWRQVTEAVHAAGGRIALQLWHAGRATHPDMNDGLQPVSSSNKPIRGDTIHTPKGKQAYPAPRPLRTDELPGIVEQFRQGAVNARAAGFDLVEVHGAHGYLLDQFLRDGVNDRTDRYGGSVENRARLLFEVIDAAIGVFGAGRIGVRISPLHPYNDMHDSNAPALVEHVAKRLEQRRAAYLHIRHTRHTAPADEELARLVRRHFRGGLIRNGGYTRDSGEADLRAGLADAIAYGTAFISNPDLPERFARNAPLNPVDEARLYTSGRQGYNDYPALVA
ncbi:MAG: alkene reductase [Opitutae bacterium]|nr:alkene reductase [Opitutae bacterium]